MKIILLVPLLSSVLLAVSGCSSLRSRIDPPSVFNDASKTGKALPDSMLSYEKCSSPRSLNFERGAGLPVAYRRFATAAYCAYFTDLDAYRTVGLFATSPPKATEQSKPAAAKPSVAEGKAGASPKGDPSGGAGTPATDEQPKDADTVTVTTSALGPETNLSEKHRQWLHAYLETGLELARENCSSFFNHRERDRVETEFWLGTASSVLAGITAALTNGGGHARSAFNIATLLTGTNAIGAQYQSSFILTPELGRLHERLEEDVYSPYRSGMRSDFRDLKYSSFSQITQDLQRYEDLCSHKSLVRALGKATDLVRFTPSDGDIPPQNRDNADKLLAKLSDDPAKVKAIRDALVQLVAFSELEATPRDTLIKAINDTKLAGVKGVLSLANELGLGANDARFLSNSRLLTSAAALLREDDDAVLNKRHAAWDQLIASLKDKDSPQAAGSAQTPKARLQDGAIRTLNLPLSAERRRSVDVGERVFGIQVMAK